MQFIRIRVISRFNVHVTPLRGKRDFQFPSKVGFGDEPPRRGAGLVPFSRVRKVLPRTVGEALKYLYFGYRRFLVRDLLANFARNHQTYLRL